MLPAQLESTWQRLIQAVGERHVLPYFVLVGSVWHIIYRLLLYPRFFSPLRSVPGPPVGEPILGRFKDVIFGEPGIPQRNWVKAFGPVVRVVGPIGSEHLIFMSPKAMKKILISDWLEYPRPKHLRVVLASMTGNGLLTVTGNEHKKMRKSLNPAFSIPNLMAQSDMYYKPIEGLIEGLNTKIGADGQSEEGKVIFMYEWLSRVTLDIICDTAFGYKSDCLHNPHNELAKAYDKLSSLQSGSNLARLSIIGAIPGAAKFLESDFTYKHRNWLRICSVTAFLADLLEVMHCIRRISSEMLEEKMRTSAVAPLDSETQGDIMSILVRARRAEQESKPGNYVMSDAAVIDQVLTFLGAGHDTISSALAWSLWLLANDPHAQRKLREEVAPLLDEDPRPGYRALKDLQWLDCVIQESLRVMPPVPVTTRQAGKTDFIDGVLVPKGTILYIPIRVINTWKEVWGEDAEEFNPARWLNLPPSYDSTFSTLSFIAGPHACIGKTMALIEMKAILAVLIANFEFTPAYPCQIPHPTANITMKPKDNLPLKVKRVTRSNL